jgi:predicted nucleic acid-binding protein
MPQSYAIDTNIIIYYLTGQPKEKYKRCLRLVKKAEEGQIKLHVLPINIWEAVWVLENFFNNPKSQISYILSLFLQLNGIRCEHKERVISALNMWKENNIDFADAYIIKTWQSKGIKQIYSYDKDMQDQQIDCLKP